MSKVSVYISERYPNLYKKLKNGFLYKITHRKEEKYLSKRRKAIQKDGYYVIEQVTEYGKKTGKIIWIDAGTLLGYVREGELLRHDYDIDFAAVSMRKEEWKQTVSDLTQSGFEWIVSISMGDILLGDTFRYKDVIFDINYYFNDDEGMYYYEHDFNVNNGSVITFETENEITIKRMEGADLYKYIMTDSEFCEGAFSNGCPCYIPANPVKRIEEMYGKNWKIPIVNDYDWTKDTENQYMGFIKNVKGWSTK